MHPIRLAKNPLIAAPADAEIMSTIKKSRKSNLQPPTPEQDREKKIPSRTIKERDHESVAGNRLSSNKHSN